MTYLILSTGSGPSVRRDPAGSRESSTVSGSCLPVGQRRRRNDQRNWRDSKRQIGGLRESSAAGVRDFEGKRSAGNSCGRRPVIAPVEAFRVKPAGGVPLVSDQV